MKKYSIHDFTIGDPVYHLSNTKFHMVVIELHVDTNLVTCKSIDSSMNSTLRDFMPQELGKLDDLKRNVKITAL